MPFKSGHWKRVQSSLQLHKDRLARIYAKTFQPIKKWNIVRGDKVFIREGADRGKIGIVKKVVRKQNALIVDGAKMKTRVLRPTMNRPGFLFQRAGLIHYSNVQLVDPTSGKPTRIRKMYKEDGTKVRVSVRSGAIIPKPALVLKPKVVNDLTDTPGEVVSKRTYIEPDYNLMRANQPLKRAARKERQAKAEAEKEEIRKLRRERRKARYEERKLRNRALAEANQQSASA